MSHLDTLRTERVCTEPIQNLIEELEEQGLHVMALACEAEVFLRVNVDLVEIRHVVTHTFIK